MSSVIGKHIDDARIREMAKRAAWLGNDESHGVRKWEECDLKHLKELISVVMNFIQSDILHDRYLAEMNEPRK